MLVDANNTHYVMFEVFVTSLGHPIGTMDSSSILLPNGQVHNTIFFTKDVLVKFPRLETYTYFQIWLGNVNDVILGMQWLDPMDAWVMCKCGLGHSTKPNYSIFELISMQTLLDTFLFSTK